MLQIIVIIALMVLIDLTGLSLKLKKNDGVTFVYDPVRKKWIVLTPEEHVRQYLLQYFITVMQYPASLIAVEKKIKLGPVEKRFDIVIYNRDHQPWLLAECKAPGIAIGENTLHQLLSYHNTLQCSYWLIGNGHTFYCADARNQTDIKWVTVLPGYDG